MQRRSLVVLLAVLAVAALFWRFGRPDRVPEQAPSAAPVKAAPPAPAAVETAAAAEPAPSSVPAAGSSDVPELPKDAPRSVRFGVVLVQYRGAEMAPSDAPPKGAALDKAKTLVAEAQKDFAEAVKKGDRGSVTDAGSMPRGVLEPAVEYVLFTLKKGEVYGSPLDTPRGFWVVRRLE